MGNMKLPQNTIMLRQRCSPIKFFQYLFWTSSIVSCQQLSQANIGFMFPIQYNGLIHPLGPAALAAAMMAVDEINRKREGVEDGMLPKTKLKMIIRSPGSVFTLGAMSAINMMYRDDGLDVVACIGPFTYGAIKGAAPSFAENGIPLLGYNERSSALGSSSTYPNVLRTVPGYYTDSVVICDVLVYFKWYRITVFYTTDETTYGAKSSYKLSVKAAELGIEILSVHSLYSGTDPTNVILEAKRFGSKVFVILMHVPDAVSLLKKGFELGLFDEDIQILGGQHLSVEANWNAIQATNRRHADLIKGMIGVRFSDRYVHRPQLDAAFKERWLARPNTNGVLQSDGSVACDETKDLSGEFYLYQFRPNENFSMPYVCAGMNYSATTEDQFSVARNAYDAVYAVAHALHGVIVEDKKYEVTGPDVHDYLLTRLDFTGLTGNVSFSTEYEDINFDVGGRSGEMWFEIVQYHAKEKTDEEGSITFNSLAVWSLQGGVEASCGAAEDYSCLDLDFASADNSIPVDRPQAVIEDMPPSYMQVLVALTTVVAIYVAFVGVVLVVASNRRIVKITQPLLSGIILGGCLLACVRVYISTLILSDEVCSALQWTSHLSYIMTFGIVLLKLWRVTIVAGGMTKRAVSLATVLKIFGVMALVSIILLAAIQGTGVHVKIVTILEDQFDFIQQRACEVTHRSSYYLLSAYEVLIFLFSLRYCYLARNVNSTVSDTSSMVSAILSVIAVTIICEILGYGAGFNPVDRQFLVSLGFVVCIGRVMFVLMNDLAVKILLGYNIDHGLKLVQNSWGVMDIKLVKAVLVQLGFSSERKHVTNATGDLDSKTLAKIAKLKNVDLLNDELIATKARIVALENEMVCLENMRFALEDEESNSSRYSSRGSQGEVEVETSALRRNVASRIAPTQVVKQNDDFGENSTH